MEKIDHNQAIENLRRILGIYQGEKPGPTIIAISGLHGNEPAGVLAIKEVLSQLQTSHRPFCGKLIAIAGNLKALREKRRYIDEDLNRMWSEERIVSLQNEKIEELNAEEQELKELSSIIDDILSQYDQPFFIDLHTTSSLGPCFAITQNTQRNIRVVYDFHVPTIVGMDVLDGTLMKYIDRLGQIAIGFEGGEHYQISSMRYLTAALWSLLASVRCIDESDFPEVTRSRKELRRSLEDLPQFFEIHYHHQIKSGDEFIMGPGFINFQRVVKGQLLAQDRRGEIRATEKSRLILPLYQGQGSDGFFLARKIEIDCV